LPGDRVNPVRRVSHQHQPRIHIPLGMERAQRIDPPPPDRTHCAEVVAEPALYLAGERGVIERDHPVGLGRPLGPDDCRYMRRAVRAGHRQLRERAAGQEMFQRRLVMRQLVRDGGDDAALTIG